MYKNIPLILVLMAGVAGLLLVLWGYHAPVATTPSKVEKPAITLCDSLWGCYNGGKGN